ncbi:MAG: hypothetical protein U0Z17_09795 [Bacteroidales bacterium]
MPGGDVPLILTTNPANNLARTPKADVYKQIKEDLLAAIAGLDEKCTAHSRSRKSH